MRQEWLWKGRWPGLRIFSEAVAVGGAASAVVLTLIFVVDDFMWTQGVNLSGYVDMLLGAALFTFAGMLIVGVPVYLLLGLRNWSGAVPLMLIGAAFVAGFVQSSHRIKYAAAALYGSCGAVAALAARGWIARRARATTP